MAHEKLKPSFVFDEEKIEKLKQLAPECFEDGKINFETLKQNLGDWTEDEDETLEHFGLFWPGKKLARKAATLEPEGTLEPVFGEGLKPDGSSDEDGINPSKNIFIEGENLEVLKLLQKSYADKIKMIYIDPPYNTGNDFVYDDDFTEPLQEYLRRTGQIDEEGKALTTNKRSDGRFHSKWLSMMYPRLRLARNLLKDDGVIFVSIDDNEVHNLRVVMNEIFGEENFVDVLKWKRKKQPSFLAKHTARVMEYILIYAKNSEQLEKLSIETTSDSTKKVINISNNTSDRIFQSGVKVKLPGKGVINSGEYVIKTMTVEYLNDVHYENGYTTNEVKVRSKFSESQENITKFIDDKLLFITSNKGLRRDVSEDESNKRKSITDLILSEWGDNQESAKEIKELFDGEGYFDYTKPTKLITNLIKCNYSEDEIILDFFAGSGTTGHAVINLNHIESGNRKFILVQLPEEIDKTNKAYKDGYHRISDITKDRIRKAINLIKDENGFKVFKLVNSNFKKWSDYKGQDVSQLTAQFEEEASSPFASGWNKNKLFTEILLIEGFPLDSKVEELNIGENRIKKVTSELVSNQLLICLDEQISTSLISDLKIDHNSSFICLDSAISNQDKLRLSDKGLIKTI
jgi:adenine-specific DNA-methyltransferase